MKTLLAMATATAWWSPLCRPPPPSLLVATPLALNSIAWDRNQDKMPATSQRPDSIGSTEQIAAVDAFSGPQRHTI
jgi:hypothetical protein